MATWEIEVDVRVRKTLWLSGPTREADVRMIVGAMLAGEGADLTMIQKWRAESDGIKPLPIETILPPRPIPPDVRDGPEIVEVRKVSDGD